MHFTVAISTLLFSQAALANVCLPEVSLSSDKRTYEVDETPQISLDISNSCPFIRPANVKAWYSDPNKIGTYLLQPVLFQFVANDFFTETYQINTNSVEGTYEVVVRLTDPVSGDQIIEDEKLRFGVGGPAASSGLRIENGILEIFHDNRWGTICDDGFGATNGQVACRQMGMEYVSHTTVDGSHSDFWLDDVNCSGSETSIAECTHRGWGNHNCSAGETVSLTCQ